MWYKAARRYHFCNSSLFELEKAMGGPQDQVWHNTSLITDDDLHLFNEGRHYRLYEKLGSHPGRPAEDRRGVLCALGAQCPRSLCAGRFQRLGSAQPCLARAGEQRHMGRFLCPEPKRAKPINIILNPTGRPIWWTRRTPWPTGARFRPARPAG